MKKMRPITFGNMSQALENVYGQNEVMLKEILRIHEYQTELEEQKEKIERLEEKVEKIALEIKMIKDISKEMQNFNSQYLPGVLQRLEEVSSVINKEGEEVVAVKLDKIGLKSEEIKDAVFYEKSELQKLAETVEQLRKRNVEAARNSSEAVWAWIFNNTIMNSSWLKDKRFSPGRWAMGYPNLYVLYRILNEMKPHNILELGLGQSTRMIGQYASAFPNIRHIIIEHDQEWIDFFCNSFQLSMKSQIIRLAREIVSYNEAKQVRVFKNFKETLENEKFDCIVIDAPLGGDMKIYSRIDILYILPNCLKDDFAIMMDDYDRIGEQNTVKEICRKIENAGISYKQGKYSGKKDCVVIASEKYSFLTSM